VGTLQPPIAWNLELVQQGLEALDADGLGAEPARYRRLAGLLESLPGEIHLGRLFQVDLVKPVAVAHLGQAVVDEIEHGVRLLHRLARRPGDDCLSRFREALVARYEGREVPLVEALDEDSGVGFDTLSSGATDASSLLEGLSFPKTMAETVAWGQRETTLLRRLTETLASGHGVLHLEPPDLEALTEPNPPPLPDACAVRASVAAASEAALANGDFQVLLGGLGGPSGARLLGRFCHADPELHQFVAQHVRAEEALEPEAVFAEIVHLPEGRLGNILARPVLRAYEIPYLGTAGVPAARHLPVTDLLVSVVGERIRLRSGRLDQRVLPRLTSAHNFHLCPGIYHILGALQAEGTAGDLGWDWGPLRDAPFLPRVVAGRLVLARSRWRVHQDELKSLGQIRGARRFRAVQTWRAARRLPRWVALSEADNELLLDLENVLAVDTFVELVKAREQATLTELFPGPDQLWARGPEGRFVHELVVPFLRNGSRETASQPNGRPGRQEAGVRLAPGLPIGRSSPRRFPPGSAWLYAKLYTGAATADQVLRDLVRPLAETALRSGAADRWFFIRYGDPDWHLRLRLHGDPQRLRDEIFPALQAAVAPLLEDGRVWRLQLDTYEQEIERYGGPAGIELAEQLFHLDSEAVLELIEGFPADAREEARWRLTLCGIDRLLTDLGFDRQAQCAILTRVREVYAREFRADANLKHQLGARFRKERPGLEALLDPARGADGPLAAGLAVLQRRSERLAPVFMELKTLEQAGRLTLPRVELAASYLHMHANRLLRSAQRAQELVLYDFLARLYEARMARGRQSA
jgi:thiopeptide-type bacteriocin biosynthesis protein